MEKRFVSDCVYELDVCKEYHKSLMWILPIERFLQMAAIFYMVAAIVYRVMAGPNELVSYGVLILITYFVIKELFSGGKTDYKRMIATNNGEAVHTTVTVAEDIHAQNTDQGTSMHFGFKQVRYIAETKNLFVIMMEQNMGVLLDKRTLNGGTVEELTEMLLQRSTDMKRKKCLNGKEARIRKAAIVVLLLIFIAL